MSENNKPKELLSNLRDFIAVGIPGIDTGNKNVNNAFSFLNGTFINNAVSMVNKPDGSKVAVFNPAGNPRATAGFLGAISASVTSYFAGDTGLAPNTVNNVVRDTVNSALKEDNEKAFSMFDSFSRNVIPAVQQTIFKDDNVAGNNVSKVYDFISPFLREAMLQKKDQGINSVKSMAGEPELGPGKLTDAGALKSSANTHASSISSKPIKSHVIYDPEIGYKPIVIKLPPKVEPKKAVSEVPAELDVITIDIAGGKIPLFDFSVVGATPTPKGQVDDPSKLNPVFKSLINGSKNSDGKGVEVFLGSNKDKQDFLSEKTFEELKRLGILDASIQNFKSIKNLQDYFNSITSEKNLSEQLTRIKETAGKKANDSNFLINELTKYVQNQLNGSKSGSSVSSNITLYKHTLEAVTQVDTQFKSNFKLKVSSQDLGAYTNELGGITLKVTPYNFDTIKNAGKFECAVSADFGLTKLWTNQADVLDYFEKNKDKKFRVKVRIKNWSNINGFSIKLSKYVTVPENPSNYSYTINIDTSTLPIADLYYKEYITPAQLEFTLSDLFSISHDAFKIEFYNFTSSVSSITNTTEIDIYLVSDLDRDITEDKLSSVYKSGYAKTVLKDNSFENFSDRKTLFFETNLSENLSIKTSFLAKSSIVVPKSSNLTLSVDLSIKANSVYLPKTPKYKAKARLYTQDTSSPVLIAEQELKFSEQPVLKFKTLSYSLFERHQKAKFYVEVEVYENSAEDSNASRFNFSNYTFTVDTCCVFLITPESYSEATKVKLYKINSQATYANNPTYTNATTADLLKEDLTKQTFKVDFSKLPNFPGVKPVNFILSNAFSAAYAGPLVNPYEFQNKGDIYTVTLRFDNIGDDIGLVYPCIFDKDLDIIAQGNEVVINKNFLTVSLQIPSFSFSFIKSYSDLTKFYFGLRAVTAHSTPIEIKNLSVKSYQTKQVSSIGLKQVVTAKDTKVGEGKNRMPPLDVLLKFAAQGVKYIKWDPNAKKS